MAAARGCALSPSPSWPLSRVGSRGLLPPPPPPPEDTDEAEGTRRDLASPAFDPSTIVPEKWAVSSGSELLGAPLPAGLSVRKVDQYGRLVPRRLGLSADGRYLWITSHSSSRNAGAAEPSSTADLVWNACWDSHDWWDSLVDRLPPHPSGGGPPPPTRGVVSWPLVSLDRVEVGAASHRFLLALENSCTGGEGGDRQLQQLLEDGTCCLTLVLRQGGGPGGGTSARRRTLDLVVVDGGGEHGDALLLRDALRRLAEWHRNEASELRPAVRALRDVCLELGLPWTSSSTLVESQFCELVRRWQIPGAGGDRTGTLIKLFRDECRRHKGRELSEDAASQLPLLLPFHRVYWLLRRASTASANSTRRSRSSAVEDLWDELVGSDPIPYVPGVGGSGQKVNRRTHRRQGDVDESDSDDEEPYGDVTVSAAAVRDFLLHSQNETRAAASLQYAIELAQAWNGQTKASDVWGTASRSCFSWLLVHEDRYHDVVDDDHSPHRLSDSILREGRLTKGSFVAYLLSDGNDLFDPKRAGYGSDNLNRPLHHYYISTTSSSSHASTHHPVRGWLDGADAASYDEHSYTALLHRGVRCLELDVGEGGGPDGLQPVVAPHRSPRHLQQPVLFASVLRVVRHFLRNNPETTPVVLAIEWRGSNPAAGEAAASLLHEYLGKPGLLAVPPNPPTKWATKSLGAPSPHSLRGKVVVLLGNRTGSCDGEGYEEIPTDTPQDNEDGDDCDETEDLDCDGTAVVVGFDEHGPIRDVQATSRSPPSSSAIGGPGSSADLLRAARDAAVKAREEADRAAKRRSELRDRAARLEAEAARFAFVAGWDAERVRARAYQAIGLSTATASAAATSPTATTSNDTYDDSPSAPRPDISPSASSAQYPPQPFHTGASWDSPLETGVPLSSEASAVQFARFHSDRRCWQLDLESSPRQEELTTAKDPSKTITLTKAPQSLVSPTAVADLVDPAADASPCGGETPPQADRAFESFVAERASVGRMLEAFLEERALARDLASRFDLELGTKDYDHDPADGAEEDEPTPPPPPGLEESWETVSMAHVAEAPAAATTSSELTDYVGSEAVDLCVRALRTRQQADAVARGLAALEEAAASKERALVHAQAYHDRMLRLAKVPASLSRLAYFHAKRHVNWDRSLTLSSANFHSFPYPEVVSRLQENPTAERRKTLAFTKGHLCRVSPPRDSTAASGSLRSNRNPDPVLLWSLGCQLVACNYRTPDETLLVADGWFRQNGNCGYVLKPSHLVDNVSLPPRPQRWSFRILSGHYLPPPADDKAVGASSPLVKLSVYSGSEHETRVSYRTRPVRRGGLERVVWDAKPWEITLVAGSVASFTVWHAREDGREVFMGAAVVPASCLREGYRSVALFDEHHQRAGPSCLLVQAERLS